MDPDAAAGYEFFDVTEENIEDYPLLGGNPAKCGWYFVLTTDFTITVEMRDGDKSSNTELFAEAVNSQFRLQGHAATGVTDVPFGEVDWKKPEITSGISSAEMTCTVRKFTWTDPGSPIRSSLTTPASPTSEPLRRKYMTAARSC